MFDTIRRSIELRKTWGEQLVGNLGIGLVFVGVALTIALVQTSLALAIVVVVLTILIVGTIALIGSAASGIFTASLYRFATKGDPSPSFRAETMSAAFRSKTVGAHTFAGPR